MPELFSGARKKRRKSEVREKLVENKKVVRYTIISGAARRTGYRQ
jgi:hypothetical protein